MDGENDRPTPKESGSFMRAEACQVVLDFLADQLEVKSSPWVPSARRRNVARRCRALSATFRSWASLGAEARKDPAERQGDVNAYLKLVSEALALGAKLPSGKPPSSPPSGSESP